jgi:hypothetical protein
MSQQPELTSPPFAANPAPAPVRAVVAVSESDTQLVASAASKIVDGPSSGRPAPQRIPRWLERAELFLRVLLRMYIGLAVCYAPWSRVFWDQNPLFQHFPALFTFATSGAIRGMVSGLGLLNLWIAFRDAFRHRDG